MRDFNRTLKEYINYSKRSLPVIVNTKAYYIARRAVRETPLAKKSDIKRFINLKSGSVAGRIINKRRGKRGEKGLYGDMMSAAVETMLAARLRSRAFIKSGWLMAVKALAPYAEKISVPSMGGGEVRVAGVPKGGAEPARESFSVWSVKAKIFNTVMAKWDRREGVVNVAIPALERAFKAEEQSMRDYIERKLKQGAEKLGIKVK